MKLFTCVLLLALTACAAGPGARVAPDMQNPQRPQAGPPFPYNTNGW